VEPVGQLDDQDPQVLGHRHQHLAHGGGLLGLLGVEVSRSSLVTPSTMAATSGPKLALDVGELDAGVLDRVVEQRGGDGDVVEAEVGDDAGHRQRVGDVGLARLRIWPSCASRPIS
jgi:hypothetical protein